MEPYARVRCMWPCMASSRWLGSSEPAPASSPWVRDAHTLTARVANPYDVCMRSLGTPARNLALSLNYTDLLTLLWGMALPEGTLKVCLRQPRQSRVWWACVGWSEACRACLLIAA
eukprot:365253-Chlamydomonas_euryale.AAC.36